ncbi:MAG TPA: hypothetical protein VHH36_00570 [Candidatus Thermoplasmatota archaeon]|nr:hypothetical protein [Candidatus Thermoplasmatota archaeon]
MSPGVRKLALTAHVTASVGWLGAVGAFLALAVAGLATQDGQTARAAYLSMDLTAWYVIVPLAFAALLTGIVQSLGTEWGLFRHHWVLAKLLLTVACTLLLLLHMRPIGHLAAVMAEGALTSDLRPTQVQLVANAGAALLALLAATALSVYKPRGVTRYGRRRLREGRKAPPP